MGGVTPVAFEYLPPRYSLSLACAHDFTSLAVNFPYWASRSSSTISEFEQALTGGAFLLVVVFPWFPGCHGVIFSLL